MLAEPGVDQGRERPDDRAGPDRAVRRAGWCRARSWRRRAISTSASIQVEAGSTIVTPASMWRSRIWRRASASATRQVGAGVDAEVHVLVVGDVGDDPPAGLAEQRQDVAEVVLALGVVVGEPAERLGQRLGGEGVGAGVDLADRELLGRGVAGGLRLDDPLEVAVGVADDPPVGCRGRRGLDGHHGRRRRRRRGGSRAARRSTSAEISGWSPERTTTVSESRTRSCAARIAPPVPSGSGWIDGLGALGQAGGEVALGRDDHRDPPGAGLARGEHRPGDHRPPADAVQHLRQRGAHSRALARGHDQDQRRAHR